MNKKGITLIALIITVIILLILAGTAISISLNGGDIFTKATAARDEWNVVSNDEHTMLLNLIDMANNANKNPTLVSQVTSEDYGKTTNYRVLVNGTTLDNWKIFLNDGNNVYLIYGDYMEARLLSSIEGTSTDIANYKYGFRTAYSSGDMSWEFNEKLRDTNNWRIFASGFAGATATGGPTLAQFNSSLGRASNSVSNIPENISNFSLYIPHEEIVDNCKGYYLAEYTSYNSSNYIRYVGYGKNIWSSEDGGAYSFCVRPLICLPGDARGTVNTDVEIDIILP